jgi:hypothetical protein
VRRDLRIMDFCQGGYFLGFEQAAAASQIQLQNVGGAGGQHPREFILGREPLTCVSTFTLPRRSAGIQECVGRGPSHAVADGDLVTAQPLRPGAIEIVGPPYAQFVRGFEPTCV